MPKTLPERFIQESVAERLNDKYYRRRSAYTSTEVYTRLKRADVLLAFMRAKSRPYVVVVEAKSRTTIHQLKLKHNAKKAGRAGRLIALALIVGLSALLGYQWYFSTWNTLLLLGLFLLGSFAISTLITRLRLSFVHSVAAIEQLGRYPANESWIAVGEDTFADPADYDTLREQCRKNGVGLIVVDSRSRLRLHGIPRPRHTFNDYLSRYGKRDDILKTIDRNPRYGPTPPERRQNRRRMLNIALLLGLTFVFILIGYERSYGPVVPDPFAEARFRTPDTVQLSGRGNQFPTQLPTTDTIARSTTRTPRCPEVGRNELVYLVVDTILPAREAELRLARLRAAGMRGHETIATGCLDVVDRTDTRVAIHTGSRYFSPSEARHAVGDYRNLVGGLGLEAPHARAVRLLPRRALEAE